MPNSLEKVKALIRVALDGEGDRRPEQLVAALQAVRLIDKDRLLDVQPKIKQVVPWSVVHSQAGEDLSEIFRQASRWPDTRETNARPADPHFTFNGLARAVAASRVFEKSVTQYEIIRVDRTYRVNVGDEHLVKLYNGRLVVTARWARASRLSESEGVYETFDESKC